MVKFGMFFFFNYFLILGIIYGSYMEHRFPWMKVGLTFRIRIEYSNLLKNRLI